jgi:ABC-type antimicrobial peptide transport system permease subunit
MMRLLPGDPVLLYIDRAAMVNVDPETLQHLRAEFGLDKPLFQQYFFWLNDVLHGNLGISIFEKLPISEIIKQRFPIRTSSILSLIFSSVGHRSRLICAEERKLAGCRGNLDDIGISAQSFMVYCWYIYSVNLMAAYLWIYVTF